MIDNRLVENFRLRNIEVKYFENLDAARSAILSLIPENCSVGVGHSVTLQKIGITDKLIERGNTVYDKELAKDRPAN